MPLLAAMLSSLMGSIFTLMTALSAAKIGARLTAVASLAVIYVSCVVYFSTIIAPWLETVFNSQYGQLLGLLFPPVSGTVIASLAGYWGCVASLKYVSSLTKMAVG